MHTNYTQQNLNVTIITKFSVSSHQLLIEKERYYNTERSERKCKMSDYLDIEDEFHFILKCPLYKDLRCIYISKNTQNQTVNIYIYIYIYI